MTDRLIPDPPLGDFPALPDDMRWRIKPPSDSEKTDAEPLRTVCLERRVETQGLFRTKTKWVPVAWSVWCVKEGLGDFSKRWPHGHGLANTMAYILHCAQKDGMETPRLRHADIHGVSKA
jgi:hypothetical protein